MLNFFGASEMLPLLNIRKVKAHIVFVFLAIRFLKWSMGISLALLIIPIIKHSKTRIMASSNLNRFDKGK